MRENVQGNEYSYSRGRPPTESGARMADWDINDSIIPRVIIYTELIIDIFFLHSYSCYYTNIIKYTIFANYYGFEIVHYRYYAI